MVSNKKFGNSLFSIAILCILIAGCSGEKETESSFKIITVEQGQLQPFLTFEKDSIAQPIDMAILPNGDRAILDLELMSVMIYDENGIFKHRMGRKGKGPGEFVRPTAIEHTDSHIYINDQGQHFWQKYTHDGSFVSSVQSVGGGFMAGDVDIITDQEYLIPADGKQKKLIQYKNTKTDSSFYFGDAMGDSTTVVNLQENADQARNGEVPDLFKNMVHIDHNANGYFVFLKSYGRLQKYNRSGELQWNKKLNLPIINQVSEEYIEANKNSQSNRLAMLLYAYDMQVTADKIYLLMNVAKDQNQVLLELTSDGTITKQYKLAYPGDNFNAFAISDSGSLLYLIDTSIGRVFSLDLSTVDQ